MNRLTKTASLVLLAVLLVTVPGLAGCAKEKGAEKEIVIGVLADFTGPAAFAVKPNINSMFDYFRMVEEENLLPEVKIKFITYDTRLDYARVVPGYVWLKGQGAMLMHVISGPDKGILADRFEKDRIPVIGAQTSTELLDHPWMFNSFSPIESQAEVEMQWIMDTWDYEELGKPKIGHVGALVSTDYYQEGIDGFLEANPGRFERVGLEKAPPGTMSWPSEVRRVKDCDYIILSLAGPMTVSFVKEARARGYEGAFVSGVEAFPGFWDLIRSAVPSEDLYGCYYVGWWPWWGEDVPFITELEEYVLKYHPDEAEAWMRSSASISGWEPGTFMFDAIKRAVEEVGAENVNGTALRNALAEIDMTVEGWGNPWKVTEKNNCLNWAQRVFEWKIAEGKWVAISDWILPPSMPVD